MPKTNIPEEPRLLLEDVEILLRRLSGEPDEHGPLRAAVSMKRIEAAAKTVTEKVLADASVEYLSTATQGKKLAYCGGVLSAYTPATEWQFPLELVSMEKQLKELKERAKVDGSAKVIKKADETRRAFKVETPFSGAPFDAYHVGADALAKLL